MSLRHFSSAFDMNKKFSGLRSLRYSAVPMANSAVMAVVYGLDNLLEKLPSFYLVEIFAVDDAVEELAAFADPESAGDTQAPSKCWRRLRSCHTTARCSDGPASSLCPPRTWISRRWWPFLWGWSWRPWRCSCLWPWPGRQSRRFPFPVPGVRRAYGFGERVVVFDFAFSQTAQDVVFFHQADFTVGQPPIDH